MAVDTGRIKLEVFGRTNNLPTNDGVDDAVAHAKIRVAEVRKWYKDATGTADDGTYPDAGDDKWDELVELESIERLMRRFRSLQDAASFRETQIQPLLGSIATTYISDWNTDFRTTRTLTPNMIRQSVISILIRKSNPAYPPLHEVDRAIYEEFAMLWECRKWRFRRRPLWLKIKTDGTVVSNDDSVSFDGIASKVITIKDGTRAPSQCVWKDSSKFSDLMGRYANESDITGRPRWFFLIPEGDTEYIQFFPEPDKEYDAFAVIYTGVPVLSTDGDDDAGLKKLPTAFRMHLRDRVVSRMMREFGERTEANNIEQRVERDYLTLLAEFDDQGSNEWSASYYRPIRYARGFASFSGRFLGGMG
jgi:hypothetical protein